MKNIVADTNVWYDIANGNQDILQVLKNSGVLCATPINILEIVSKIDESNFIERQNAAKAIVEHTDRYLRSNEDYLGRYWGVNIDDQIHWKEASITLSRASSFQSLVSGYYDSVGQVNRKHNVELLKSWRGFQYNDFKNGVIKAIESIHPNYVNRSNSGNLRRLLNQEHISLFNSKEMKKNGVFMTYERVKLAIKIDKIKTKDKKTPTNKMINQAFPKLKNYINAYNQYLKYLATTPALPDENDLGDHEAFMYLQNKNWILATSDKRWVQIGQKVCPNNILNLLAYK